jgi:hypothetical protein
MTRNLYTTLVKAISLSALLAISIAPQFGHANSADEDGIAHLANAHKCEVQIGERVIPVTDYSTDIYKRNSRNPFDYLRVFYHVSVNYELVLSLGAHSGTFDIELSKGTSQVATNGSSQSFDSETVAVYKNVPVSGLAIDLQLGRRVNAKFTCK